jgi:hypothetical protein
MRISKGDHQLERSTGRADAAAEETRHSPAVKDREPAIVTAHGFAFIQGRRTDKPYH